MSELGNIILNACLSAMADYAGITLNSSLPTYAVSSPRKSPPGLPPVRQDDTYVLVLRIDLLIEKHHASGG